MKTLNDLFNRNLAWATQMKKENPDYFEQLAQQQTPEYLWIGCSDSRVPPNQIMNLLPGELFVHRNIANLIVAEDLNCLSVIQYAVEVLKVKHIIVCGHYECGGIKAAMENQEYGLIDRWLGHIQDVIHCNHEKFEKLDSGEKLDLLCEINIVEQVKNVCNTTIVQNAWKRGAELTVHGWIYDIKNGFLKDLDKSVSSVE